HDLDELRALLDALCEESINAEQVQRLEELVLARPEAEAYYVQYMSLHADLVGHFGAASGRAEQSLRDRLATGRSGEPSGTAATPVLLGERDLPGQKPTKPASRIPFLRSPRFLVSFSALAAVLLLALALWQRQRVVPTGPKSMPEALDSTVAVLL